MWFRLAAEQGEAIAQFNLANKYFYGQGLPQDYTEAYIWFSLAAAAGHEKAKENLEASMEKLSPEQLIQAQSRATELFKQIEERQR